MHRSSEGDVEMSKTRSAPRAVQPLQAWTKELCSKWTVCRCLPHARLGNIKESAIKCHKKEKVHEDASGVRELPFE